MLTKHIIGYIPSFVIPAVIAFAAIYTYTRLLTPVEYGHFALTTNMMTLLVAVVYNWLQICVPRLMPQAIKEGWDDRFRVTVQIIYLLLSLLLALSMLLCLAFTGPGDFRVVAAPALLLTFARALTNINQSFHRANLNFSRYNVIECGQAVIGFIVGLSLVYFAGLGARGAVGGMIAGMVCMALIDLKTWLTAPWRQFSRQAFREILHYGLPMIVSFGFSVVVSTSDRFLIDYFRGPEQVGIYAAGYTLTDRISGILFMMIAIASLPLTVNRLEHEGFDAARDQTRRNGVAALMLGLPACAGLVLANRQLAHAFIGEAFRGGALTVMPLIAISGFFNGLTAHYFDHAFHLGKRTRLFVFTLGPAALLNLTLNLILIPRYGIVGAAWSTLATSMLLMSLSITIGRRAFPIRFPFRQAIEIGVCVAAMAAAVRAVTLPENVAGLIATVALGAGTYLAGLLLLNVMDARARLGKFLTRLR